MSVIFRVSFSCFLGMMPSMNCMPARGMGVVGRFFVVSAFMMLGSFRMVVRSVLMMLGCLLVVFSSFFRHWNLQMRPGRNSNPRARMIGFVRDNDVTGERNGCPSERGAAFFYVVLMLADIRNQTLGLN